VSSAPDPNLIEIVLNGVRRTVPGALSVAGLLAHLEIDPARVAVELNRTLVRRPQWDSTPVEPGAEVEVVHFVGGGF
jgi:sulfur carrier protein